MRTQKDRRHSGYVSPQPTITYKDILKYDWFINDFYSDWDDYRDGFRDWFSDHKRIKKRKFYDPPWNDRNKVLERMNQKQKKLLKRRKKRIAAKKQKT